MKRVYLTIYVLCLLNFSSEAQYFLRQYFDGADTITGQSVRINFDTSGGNVWQVGKPQKTFFNNAFTLPNALITDTINSYPVNNTSRFTIKFRPENPWGIVALHWAQKLDLDLHHDGGIIEFSVDSGTTWTNAFNNPHVYNFYGYQMANQDTLPTGEFAFSGRDTSWRDVWLCFDRSWLSTFDSIYIRYSLTSDSVQDNRDGWMIDNMIVHTTVMHPVKEVNKKDYMNVFPNPTKDIVNVEIQRVQRFQIIETMELYNSAGILMKEWKNIPGKFWFDTSKYEDGIYYLKVKTNSKSETIQLIVKK